MAGLKFVILRFAFKKRRLGAIGLGYAFFLQQFGCFQQVNALLCVKRRAHGNEQQTVFRAGTCDVQRLIKTLTQTF